MADTLYHLCSRERWSEVEERLRSGDSESDWAYQGPKDWAALHILIKHNAPVHLVEQVLNNNLHNVDVNKPLKSGATPLFIAAQQNVNVKLVELLLEHGAEVSKATITSKATPLYVAVEKNASCELVELLLRHGADINQPNVDGFTPLYVAAQNNVKPELMDLLLDHGADVNKATTAGATPLFIIAQQNGNITLAELLLHHGADVNKATQKGSTPLIMAAERGSSPALVSLLLESGADVDATFDGKKAIDYATYNGRLDLIAILSQPDAVVLPSVTPKIEHLIFFSYAKADTSAESAILAEKARLRFPNASIFRDAETKFKLNELITHVESSRNVIVLLSGNYVRRPYTLVKLNRALKSEANVVIVRVVHEGMRVFDMEEVEADLENGKVVSYLSADGWKLLQDHGIQPADVMADLRKVLKLPMIEFPATAMRPTSKDQALVVNAVLEKIITS